jgi:hypothetical protein
MSSTKSIDFEFTNDPDQNGKVRPSYLPKL